MPLERYSSIEQAEDRLVQRPNPAVALERMLELASLVPANLPPLFEPGVYPFRSVEEANEAREVATATRMRLLRADRASRPSRGQQGDT